MPLDYNPDHARGDGLFGLPYTEEEARVVILPIPWEATACYGTGTAQAPEAIRKASPHLDLVDPEAGRAYEHGITLGNTHDSVAALNEQARALAEPIHQAGDAGDNEELTAAAREVDRLSEEMNALVRTEAARLLGRGKIVGGLGGDHSTPFGLIQALAEHEEDFGILHVDAHCDLRNAYMGFTWSHASIMFNVMERLPGVTRLVQVGIRDYANEEAAYIESHSERVKTFFDPHLKRTLMSGASWDSVADPIIEALPSRVYVSFDIDGLDPSNCPHTGTPVPGGLSFDQGMSLVRKVRETGRRIVGFDLNEIAPDPTGTTEWDANVGARVLYKLIGFTLNSQPR